MTSQFTLTSVEKSYGNKRALTVKELTIWTGSVYSLTGPNGSGKSTLLNILALLVKPDAGQVAFQGTAVNWNSGELSALRRKVTLLHQTPFLFTGTVFANVAFGLKVRSVSRRELRRRVSHWLAQVGLAGFENRDVRRLSGGEVRRVALARTLATETEILLLDEPLANLDSEHAVIVERLLAEIASRGTTIVMASHDPRHTSQIGGHEIRLSGGRLDNGTARPYAAHTSNSEQVQICPPLTMPAT